MGDVLMNLLFGRGKKRGRKPRQVEYGDIVAVEENFLDRYGIWTGENFIQYSKNKNGQRVVHEVSFKDFLSGAERFLICEFPKKYGRPTEWEQPVASSSFVAPYPNWLRIIDRLKKEADYRLYTPDETVKRAKSKLGEGGFWTSEHFAMWCKTGISESHQLEDLRKLFDLQVVY